MKRENNGKRHFVRMRLMAAVLLLGLALSLPAAAGSAYDRGTEKLIALTFDDGPGRYSEQILDAFNAHGAKATFFMTGGNAKNYPNAVRRMKNEGFQVANHTYNHPSLANSSNAKIQSELSSTAAVLRELTGVKGSGNGPFYLRPPYGSYNKRVLGQAGVPVIFWSVDTLDWKYRNGDRLYSYVTQNVKDGDIVLMHETVPSTVSTMNRLLTQLKKQGFTMVTVEELFWRRGVTPQAGVLYKNVKNTGVNRCARELYWDENCLDQHWAYSALLWSVEQEFLQKNEWGEVLPNFPMTRGDLVTALGRMTAKTDKGRGLNPVGDAQYFSAWGQTTGIMVGDGGDPAALLQRGLSRQELATILVRYLDWYSGEKTAARDAAHFQDSGEIAAWAGEAVAVCQQEGLLLGVNESFLPNDSSNRAMGVTCLQRLSELCRKKDSEASSKEPTTFEGVENSFLGKIGVEMTKFHNVWHT